MNKVSIAQNSPDLPIGFIICCTDNLGLPLIELPVEIPIVCKAILLFEGGIGLMIDGLALHVGGGCGHCAPVDSG